MLLFSYDPMFLCFMVLCYSFPMFLCSLILCFMFLFLCFYVLFVHDSSGFFCSGKKEIALVLLSSKFKKEEEQPKKTKVTLDAAEMKEQKKLELEEAMRKTTRKKGKDKGKRMSYVVTESGIVVVRS